MNPGNEPNQSTSTRFSPELLSSLNQELRSLFLWRLALISLFTAALALLVGFLSDARTPLFASAWLTIVLFQVLLLLLTVRARKIRALYMLFFSLLASNLLWFLPLSGLGIFPTSLLQLFLVIASGFLISFGVQFRYSLALSLFVLILFARLVPTGPLALPTFLALIIVEVIAWRTAAINHQSTIARLSYNLLLSACTSSRSSLANVRLLTRQLALMVDTSHALIVFNDGESEVISEDAYAPCPIDKVYPKSLFQRLTETEFEEGLFKGKELGPEFQAALQDWFSFIPSRFFFVKLETIVNDATKKILIVVPVSMPVILVGIRRTFLAFRGQVSVVRMALAAQRNSFFSSESLSASQIAGVQREQELNQVIHQVNNVCQEVSIYCEDLKSIEGVGEKQTTLVRKIENALRHMAAAVSDVKILRELLRLKSYSRKEQIDLAAIAEEIDAFGQHRAYRKGVKFNLTRDAGDEIDVQVSNQEFMGLSLRLMLRLAFSNLAADQGAEGQVELVIKKSGSIVSFKVQDNGVAVSEEIKKSIEAPSGPSLKPEMELIQAIHNFAQTSNGSIKFEVASPPYVNCFTLKLNCVAKKIRVKTDSHQWALLVDDNPEVTTFYARIADALALKYQTASSIAEAEAIVKARGEPRLVISDIQLGDGSGLDLVRALKTKFGSGLPVIVVSGNNDPEIGNAVSEVHASVFLSKPVGRRRLFAEIQEILSK